MKTYHVSIQGQVTGPFTASQIRNMWTAGTITADALFLEEGASDWREVRHSSELTEAPAASVTVKQEDPFAILHTPIKGRSAGPLTWIGWAGVIVGVLSLPLVPFGGVGVPGVLMGVAAYFWCRKPVVHQ